MKWDKPIYPVEIDLYNKGLDNNIKPIYRKTRKL